MEILCFFAGIAFFYLKSIYPLFFLFSLLFFRPKLHLILWFLGAIFWGVFHQWSVNDKGMPDTNLIKMATLQGYISSIPNQTPVKTQFQFLAELRDGNRINAALLLSCYQQCPKLHVGEHWQLRAKLKRPVNLGNPGGFDYVSWLHSRHVQWVGNIKAQTFIPLAGPKKHYPFMVLRERLAFLLSTLFTDEALLGIVEALTLGLTNHIDKSHWDLFRRTGTTHLIDISGEHIAIIAGLSYAVFKWVWKHLGQSCLYYPAPKIASLGAVIVSFLYALVAGFAVPTQRALITCCFLFFRNMGRHKMSVWQSWRYALFAVLLFEPHSVFMLGFYFSFIAVAILILINQRFQYKGLRKMLLMQSACLFGLMPLTLYWFSYTSINGLVANLLAIPWVGFVIVPLALLITFLSPWVVIPKSVMLLKGAIYFFLYCLRGIDSFELFNFTLTFTEALSPLALMAAIAIFLFLPLPKLLPATSLLIVATFFPRYEKIKSSEVTVDVLDVGQGLSVVVRTAHHVLIYDTGMKFFHGGDMGKLAIIPYLTALGIKQLDKVVISHPDLDHRGGLASLEEKYPIKEFIVDNPNFYKRGLSCHQYPSWAWDNVVFRFFPINIPLKSKNNRSCVLQISTRAGEILLTGDIEKSAEDYLTKTYGQKLRSSVVVIPHHGSKTSSSRDFVHQIAPQYALVSYGFDNRYHFPHQEALQVYESPIYNTLDCGMIRVHINTQKLIPPQCYRTPYWTGITRH